MINDMLKRGPVTNQDKKVFVASVFLALSIVVLVAVFLTPHLFKIGDVLTEGFLTPEDFRKLSLDEAASAYDVMHRNAARLSNAVEGFYHAIVAQAVILFLVSAWAWWEIRRLRNG